LADSPRVKIDTQHLSGSIALKGARIDDIVLKDYRETPDPKSPEIILLSPANAPTPYYAENGYVSQPGVKLALPDANTLWTADRSTLTPATPVTLTVDNGQGLVFHRKISIDDNYMLEIGDTVENKGATPAVLFPYSLILRQGLPQTSGYSVLHEGYVGVVGDSGVQDMTYAGILKETNATKTLKGTGGWVGFTDKYWATALIPDQKHRTRHRREDFPGGYVGRGLDHSGQWLRQHLVAPLRGRQGHGLAGFL
jgi:YidC/Oxa1 family membrane protein insertase